MSKEYNEQLMKFKITNDKLKMEIKLKDLEWLFLNSPENYGYTGEDDKCKVKHGKRQEFAEYIVSMLLDDVSCDSNNCRWLQPLEDIFMEIFEGAEDEFIKYPSDEED